MDRFVIPLCLASVLLSGCVSIRIGTEEDSSSLRMKGLASGYGSIHGIRPYDGTFFELGVLKKSRRSQEFEVAYVDLWPLMGVGVGIAGARVQLLFLDVGVGVLAYDPQPPSGGSDEEQEGGEDKNGDEVKDEKEDVEESEVGEAADGEAES